MAADKKSFVLYSDLIHTVRHLPKEKIGELFLHILSYVNDENPVSDDVILNIAFEPVRQSLKRDLVKYESRAERSRSNGSLGGRPKKETQKNPMGFDKTQQNPNEPEKPDSVSVSVSVSDNVILLEKETKESNGRFTPPSLLEVQNLIIEKKYLSVSAQSFWNFYESKNWYVGKNKMKDWKKALAGWESREKEKNGKSNQTGNVIGLQVNR